jgi:peptidoglycan/xylan/chitin deacetylase (PgdA/CDA1 family)
MGDGMMFPAIFLSFDDLWIDEWYATFAESRIKVTFYSSNLANLTDDGWKKLKALEDAGHTIGFHGLNHIRAGAEVAARGPSRFMADEIMPGLRLFGEHGLRSPLHYSYPWGNRTVQSDDVLLDIFRTLRGVGGDKTYSPVQIKRMRVFQGNCMRNDHRGLLENTVRGKGAAFVYLHQPILERLRVIYKYADRVYFYPMGVLDA